MLEKLNKNIIVTGGAGFIGSNLCKALLDIGCNVTCIDNFDDYYSKEIKLNNLLQFRNNKNFIFIEADVKDSFELNVKLQYSYDVIIHLAAKAGVRYSICNPEDYEESNILSTKRILEFAVQRNIKQFVFASSSSVYGNVAPPFKEDFTNLQPISPYAKTKLECEKIGKDFSEKYDITFIALRFFSVYGPAIRPDLVIYKIVQSIFNQEVLKIYGNGQSARDYTFVDDIINGIIKSIDYKQNKFEIFNLGSGQPIKLLELIDIFEKVTSKRVNLEFVNQIQGESEITWADNSKARGKLDFNPKVDIEHGVRLFLNHFNK